MKKRVLAAFIACIATLCACSGDNEYVLNEQTFFLVMTNIQYYPDQYLDKSIEYDCFTYELTDVNGQKYVCGVRKCSSGYGCRCGKDTVIGFLLEYDGEVPQPKNQSADTNDKAWIHLKGKIKGTEKTSVKVYAYVDEEIDYNTVETIEFLSFKVESLSVIEDYSGLNYYVTK